MVFKLSFSMCARIQQGVRQVLWLSFWALSLWQLGLNTVIHVLASLSLTPYTHTQGRPDSLYSASAPDSGGPAYERPKPSICLKGEGRSDTFCEALVLEMTTFWFPYAECRYSSSDCPRSAVLLLLKVWSPGPEESTSPDSLLEMQILGPYLRPTVSESKV